MSDVCGTPVIDQMCVVVEVRDFGEPEAVVSSPLAATYQVRIAGTVISRHVLQPGWNWEEHAKPLVGTASCELYHRGIVIRGRMGVRTEEGAELVIAPNQVFDIMPRHLTWVEGDEALEMVDWAGGAGFDIQPGEENRTMITILFTDIVDSTVLARKAGAAIGIAIRVGIHSGEVVLSGDDIRGVAVHTAARIVAQAGADEVLVSGSTHDLAEGATGLTFDSRGRHRLKGLEREHELFAAASTT